MTRNRIQEGKTTRRVYRSVSPWTGLLLVVPVLVLAGQSGPVTLRMKFKQGETTKYQTNMKMNMEMPMMPQQGGMKMDLSLTQHNTVKKTLPNGGGEVEVVTRDQKVIMNGQPTNSGAATPTLTMVYDAQGNVKSTEGLPQNAPGGGAMMGNFLNSPALQGNYLPVRPVKPGDTWTSTVKIPGVTNNTTVKGLFLKQETIGRYKTAKIRTTISGPMNMMMTGQGQPTIKASEAMMKMTGSMSVTTDTNFAIAEGKIIRQAGNITMNLNMKPLGQAAKAPQGAMPASMKMNMKMQMGTNLME